MRLKALIPALLILLLTRSAFAVKIADITRMYGARTNMLIGMGLVTGLKGTGDGGAFLPAMKPLAGMFSKFQNPTAVADLSNASNVAIVNVYATMPAGGVSNGDHLDVRVTSLGAAASLKGGTLYNVSLMGPDGKPFTPRDPEGHALSPIPFATATGSIELEDATSLTSGIVKGGAVMEVDLPARYIDRTGHFTLIIDDPAASWVMASSIAKLINESNESGDTIAVAVDTKRVVVTIPAAERAAPDNFIATVLQLPVRLQPAEARVRVNTKTGTIIATGDVEISPTVISHKGLTITTVNPVPIPTIRNPQVITKSTIPLDTTNSGGAKLTDLATAFDQLKVPVDDRIDIIKELYKTGYLHAKLNIDGVDQ
jgi:flagellar P-ring protein precursor FlgI